MREATRLTQAGRLSEATALIQRTLQGTDVAAPSDPPEAPSAYDIIIESEFRVAQPASAPAALPALPGVITTETHSPAPTLPLPATPTRLPEVGSRGEGGQFLSATYTAQAGTRPYQLYVPSGYCGQALPLLVMLHA